MNRELKSQISDERNSKESFENAYFRVLEENIVLQAGSTEKREWVKTLYRSVKQYKMKVANTMKSNIRTVAAEQAARDGDLLNLEGVEEENIELEELLKLNQVPPVVYENEMTCT